MPARYPRRARATTASASPASRKKTPERQPLVMLPGGAIAALDPDTPLPAGARLWSEVRDEENAARARDEEFLALVRAETAKGPRVDEATGLLATTFGGVSLAEAFEHEGHGASPTERTEKIRAALIRACAALRAMHDYAGRIAVRQKSLATIERGGRRVELTWTEDLQGAVLWFAPNDPDVQFGVAAAGVALLLADVERVAGEPRPTSLSTWDVGAVHLCTADGALHVGAGWRQGAVRFDWDDLPALLNALRQARELAGAWEARR